MKIEITQRDLAKVINISQRAISSRNTIQILEGILFEAKDDYLILSSTDLELSIETKIPCLVEREGKIVINSSVIGNIVRKLPDAPVSINVVGENIELKCLKSEFNLQGNNPVDYPKLPKRPEDISFVMEESTLKNAIRQTVFAASLDETRPALTGVLIKKEDGIVDFCALDGFRISLKQIMAQGEDSFSHIVPARAMVEIHKVLGEEKAVNISFVTGHVLFDLGETLIFSRLLEGKFINYHDIINVEHGTRVVLDKKGLQDSLERASLLAREDKANLIRLNITDTNIHISSNSETGSVDENVDCDKRGGDLEIGFNAKYVLDGLKVIDHEKCELLFNGSLNPCIIHPIDEEVDYTYLVLPVRIARD